MLSKENAARGNRVARFSIFRCERDQGRLLVCLPSPLPGRRASPGSPFHGLHPWLQSCAPSGRMRGPILVLADDADAYVGAVAHPAFGLGGLGVVALPFGGEGGAGVGGDVLGFVVVGAAGRCERAVFLCHPFGDVADHVVEAPGVGLFLGDLVGGVVGVVDVPGLVLELGFVGDVLVEAGGLAGVLPLGLGGEAVLLAGDLGEPLDVLGGLEGVDGAGGEAGVAPAAVGGG